MLEERNFRAHTFASPKFPDAWDGEWVKWLNRARPSSNIEDDAITRWARGDVS
jgi:hypothetical protein